MPRVKQILFPVDFSKPSVRAAAAVAAVAKQFKGTLTLLHAATTPVIPELIYPEPLYSAVREEIREASTKALDRFAGRHDAAVEDGDGVFG